MLVKGTIVLLEWTYMIYNSHGYQIDTHSYQAILWKSSQCRSSSSRFICIHLYHSCYQSCQDNFWINNKKVNSYWISLPMCICHNTHEWILINACMKTRKDSWVINSEHHWKQIFSVHCERSMAAIRLKWRALSSVSVLVHLFLLPILVFLPSLWL